MLRCTFHFCYFFSLFLVQFSFRLNCDLICRLSSTSCLLYPLLSSLPPSLSCQFFLFSRHWVDSSPGLCSEDFYLAANSEMSSSSTSRISRDSDDEFSDGISSAVRSTSTGTMYNPCNSRSSPDSLPVKSVQHKRHSRLTHSRGVKRSHDDSLSLLLQQQKILNQQIVCNFFNSSLHTHASEHSSPILSLSRASHSSALPKHQRTSVLEVHEGAKPHNVVFRGPVDDRSEISRSDHQHRNTILNTRFEFGPSAIKNRLKNLFPSCMSRSGLAVRPSAVTSSVSPLVHALVAATRHISLSNVISNTNRCCFVGAVRQTRSALISTVESVATPLSSVHWNTFSLARLRPPGFASMSLLLSPQTVIPATIKTPLKAAAFAAYSVDHPDKKFVNSVLDILVSGADIGYRGPSFSSFTKNALSARTHHEFFLILYEKKFLFRILSVVFFLFRSLIWKFLRLVFGLKIWWLSDCAGSLTPSRVWCQRFY